MQTHYDVVITGAGIAGLSTAYYLSKANPNLRIAILEASNRVGGRIETAEVEGEKVDMGAFMIFPWYKYLIELCKELNIYNEITPLKYYVQYFEVHKGKYILGSGTSGIGTMIYILKNLPLYFSKQIDLYKPNYKIFKNKSAYQILRPYETKQDRDFINQLLTACTYPNTKKISAAMLVPFIFSIGIGGGFNKFKTIKKGTSLIVDSIVKLLKERDIKIVLNEPVENIDVTKKIIKTDKAEYTYNSLVLSHNLESRVYPQVIKDIEFEYSYTKHYWMVCKLNKSVKFNNNTKWFITYNKIDKAEPMNINSIVNLSASTSLPPEYILLGIISNDLHQKNISKKANELFKEKFGREYEIEKILVNKRWEKTMPLVDTKLQERFHLSQGNNNIYFAGDYLYPASMETAVFSGKNVAEMIVK